MSYIQNHIALGLNRLLEQYKNKIKISGVLSSFIRGYQSLEDVLNDINKYARINKARGKVLDRIGENFKVARNELTDTLYLQKIYTSILISRSKGNIQGIATAIRLLYNPKSLYIIEYDCVVQINMVIPTNIVNIANILQSIVASGVRAIVVYETLNCGSLASSAIASVQFEVDKEDGVYLLQAKTENNVIKNFGVRSSIVKIPKKIFTLSQRFQYDGDTNLIKGSDFAIRLNLN